MNTDNSKTNEPHKTCALQTVCYMWKNIRQQCKNNKLKIIALTWIYEFELPDASYSESDIQDYIEYIIKSTKH